MNVLFGAYAADEGAILVEGRPVRIASPADALALGIGMVHQHFHLAPRLTVLENLLVGLPGRRGRLDRAGGLGAARRDRPSATGCGSSPTGRSASLSVGEQQRLEIVKALFRGARLLILDEPTAVLTPDEVEGLFAALRSMAAQGLGIVLISHKLNEIRALDHRCIVLRHGRVAGHVADPAATSAAEMARLMCGHEIVPPRKSPARPRETVLPLEDVSTGGHAGMPLRGVSLAVRGGEILGVAGVSGNGQSALADVVAGVLRPSAGRVAIGGSPVVRFTPREVQAHGPRPHPGGPDGHRAGHQPAARRQHGAAAHRARSAAGACCGARRSGGSPTSRSAASTSAAPGRRCAPARSPAATCRRRCWPASSPSTRWCCSPRSRRAGSTSAPPASSTSSSSTSRERGRGLLVISEDLEELLALSDRIAVMYEGRIAGVLDAAEASVARLGLLMSGAGGHPC